MLTGMPISQVIIRATAAGIDITGGLSNDSDQDRFVSTGLFATTFGLTMLPPMSWLPIALANTFNDHGPLMLHTLSRPDDYVSKAGSPGHSSHCRHARRRDIGGHDDSDL